MTRARTIVGTALLIWPAVVLAQQSPAPVPVDVHEHVAVAAPLLTPTRETSGTAWVPAVTPMFGVHRPWRGWDLRFDGAALVQALFEPGDRHRTGGFSTRQGGSVNWAMLGARRPVGGGRFGIRTMVSAEPWTVPGCGSLSFLSLGEVCEGDIIHDRQQPHDLVMELAADYDHGLRGDWRWQVYAGVAGEPALGPPGYLHRASAVANPIGPITHHWLDSTHATFGLVTLGVHNRQWKVEVSAFNGRDPDESRVDLDVGALDSFSGRVSVLATQRLALQVSAARFRDARTDFIVRSEERATRVTASAAYHVPLAVDGIWATTLAFGVDHASEVAPGGILEATTTAALLESSATLSNRHTLFGRGELAGMPAHHLHAHELGASVFTVGKIQAGYERRLSPRRGMVPGIGASAALSLLPPALAPRYFGRVAPGFSLFFRLQAARHQM